MINLIPLFELRIVRAAVFTLTQSRTLLRSGENGTCFIY